MNQPLKTRILTWTLLALLTPSLLSAAESKRKRQFPHQSAHTQPPDYMPIRKWQGKKIYIPLISKQHGDGTSWYYLNTQRPERTQLAVNQLLGYVTRVWRGATLFGTANLSIGGLNFPPFPLGEDFTAKGQLLKDLLASSLSLYRVNDKNPWQELPGNATIQAAIREEVAHSKKSGGAIVTALKGVLALMRQHWYYYDMRYVEVGKLLGCELKLVKTGDRIEFQIPSSMKPVLEELVTAFNAPCNKVPEVIIEDKKSEKAKQRAHVDASQGLSEAIAQKVVAVQPSTQADDQNQTTTPCKVSGMLIPFTVVKDTKGNNCIELGIDFIVNTRHGSDCIHCTLAQELYPLIWEFSQYKSNGGKNLLKKGFSLLDYQVALEYVLAYRYLHLGCAEGIQYPIFMKTTDIDALLNWRGGFPAKCELLIAHPALSECTSEEEIKQSPQMKQLVQHEKFIHLLTPYQFVAHLQVQKEMENKKNYNHITDGLDLLPKPVQRAFCSTFAQLCKRVYTEGFDFLDLGQEGASFYGMNQEKGGAAALYQEAEAIEQKEPQVQDAQASEEKEAEVDAPAVRPKPKNELSEAACQGLVGDLYIWYVAHEELLEKSFLETHDAHEVLKPFLLPHKTSKHLDIVSSVGWYANYCLGCDAPCLSPVGSWVAPASVTKLEKELLERTWACAQEDFALLAAPRLNELVTPWLLGRFSNKEIGAQLQADENKHAFIIQLNENHCAVKGDYKWTILNMETGEQCEIQVFGAVPQKSPQLLQQIGGLCLKLSEAYVNGGGYTASIDE